MTIKVRRGRIGSRAQQAHFDAVSRLAEFSVSDLPDPAENEGRLVRVPDGDEGSRCLAISDGETWRVVPVGSTVSED